MGGLLRRQTTQIIHRTLSSRPGLYFFLHISASSGIFDLPKIPIFVLARPTSMLLRSADSDPFQFYQQQTQAMASRRHPRKGPPTARFPLAQTRRYTHKRHIHRSFRIIFGRFSSLRHSLAPYLYTYTTLHHQYRILLHSWLDRLIRKIIERVPSRSSSPCVILIFLSHHQLRKTEREV